MWLKAASVNFATSWRFTQEDVRTEHVTPKRLLTKLVAGETIMDQGIFRDRRVRSLKWRDLVKPSSKQIVVELLLVTPWLAASLMCAHWAARIHFLFYVPALCSSFVFFLTGLRVVHNGYHYALGLPRWATEWVMFVLSVMMGWSLHAV